MRNQFKISAFALATLIGAAAANAQTVRVPLPAPNSQSQILRMNLPSASFLGVQTEDVSAENFGKYNLNEVRGVAVTKVVENSPAARAGLREKDVILRLDNEQIKSAAKLTRLISEIAPDQKATLTIYRNGGEQEIQVTMGKRPALQGVGAEQFGNILPFPPSGEFRQVIPLPPGSDSQSFGAPDLYEDFLLQRGNTGRKLGVGVTPLSRQLADFFGAPNGAGLLIQDVAADSAAAKANLKAGDVILEIDGAPVANQIDLIRALNKNQEGEVSITILRDKQRQTLRATPDGGKKAAADNGTKFKV